MKVIESAIYERVVLDEGLESNVMYIFVPITLLVMQYKEKSQTHFIFWN